MSPSSPERVLVVDDEEAVRRVVVAVLRSNGFHAESASGVEEALRSLAANPACQLVLTDLRMPGVDGFGFLDLLGTRYPSLPVVMVTAVHDIHTATSAFRRGAVDYLLKPFEQAHLLEVVTRAVDNGRLTRQEDTYRQTLEATVRTRTSRIRAMMHDLEHSYETTLEAMGDALDLRDTETQGHSKRVTAYTVSLAREMHLSHRELLIIAHGAYLHDIGKIATPDSILLKPGRLDEQETATMRQHCEHGYQIVRKIPFLREASEIVRAHQERFDGTGYPRGLRGDQIPLGARIFAIADTLDAITSDRPYRKAASFAEAREEIVRCSGGQFDPTMIQHFLRIPTAQWAELRARTEHLPIGAISSLLRLRAPLLRNASRRSKAPSDETLI